MFYRCFTIDVLRFSFLQKKQKMKYSTSFSFFIFKRKMKNETQLTPVILFFDKD